MKFLDSLIKKWFSLGFGANSPSKTILGVDISSSAIKLIEMEPSREGFNVIAYGVEPLPEGATFDREIVDVAKIAQVLHSVYKKSGARSRNVAVAVSGSSIISNYIDVPSSLTAKQVEARIKYAESKDIYKFFTAPRQLLGANRQQGSGGQGAQGSTFSILSGRGSAIIDERTNTIILTDIAEKINEFKRLLTQIDIPVKQVLIEARIVKAESDFRKELGASWGLAGSDEVDFSAISDSSQTLSGKLGIDLGVSDPRAAFALSYLSDNLLIDLELSALEAGGFGEIVSQPKVLTADKKKASIKSGVEIPYQAVTNNADSANSVVETQFKEAVLMLEVTPQITPDNRVIMDILVKQDSVGSFTVNGEPAINITEISTQALVGNGQTLVLGGIFQSEELTGDEKVPLLGDLPLVGGLFKKQMRSKDKREILIFITPKIIDNR